MSSNYRIEPLKRNNYDTWKIQAEAILIQNNLWEYVNGKKKCPEDEDGKSTWVEKDLRARSELILIISPNELKLVKSCKTSKEVWDTLLNTYQSSGPARKAFLLKQLIIHKMKEGDDVRDHVNRFMDIVDKLKDMGIDIHSDLLSIMMLYSLSPSFDNFRVAIESRDNLPSPDDLKIKIIEESDARSKDLSRNKEDTLFCKPKPFKPRNNQYISKPNNQSKQNLNFKIKCFKCGKIGHKANNCRSKQNGTGFKVEAECLSTDLKSFDRNSSTWCLDSGCTSHMCGDKSQFKNIESSEGTLKLASSGQTADITGIGEISLDLGKHDIVHLSNTLHVPNLATNLLSVGKITHKGFKVTFDRDKATVCGSEGNVVLTAERQGGLYYVKNAKPVLREEKSNFSKELQIVDWHKKLGHLNESDLKLALKNELVNGLEFNLKDEIGNCETCIQGKLTQTPFPTRKTPKSVDLLEVIHSDIVGPIRVTSPGGNKYSGTFIDESSRYCHVYFLKTKDEMFKCFKEFKNEVENQTGKRIKYLQTDNGTEYCNTEFDQFLKENGIKRRLTVPYTPQQNGLAERKNRTLLDMARCMLLESNQPEMMWAEAVHTANYIRNRCPSKSIENVTPYEKWVGRKPSVRHFKIFGSKVFVLNKTPNRGKFYPRAEPGIFVGYADTSKAYRIWMPYQKKIKIARDVKVLSKMFYENKQEETNYELLYENDTGKNEENPNESEDVEEDDGYIEVPVKPGNEERNGDYVSNREDSSDDGNNPEDNDRENENYELPENNEEQSRPVRQRKPPTWTQDYQMSANCKQREDVEVSEEWDEAIKNEIRAHLKNETWVLESRNKASNIIGSKMVLKNKYKSNGELERRKARLVAKGFAQKPGVDFEETFAPVAKLSSIRLLLGLAVEEDMKIDQMDVSTAFLNGEIKEKVFMEIPQNLEKYLHNIMIEESFSGDRNMFLKAKKMLEDLKSSKNEKVCLLKKAIYGLKQAGRQWYMKLDTKLKELQFTPSYADPCIYISILGGEKIIIAVYVDDIVIFYKNDKRAAACIKSQLMKIFEMRDLGKLNYCLGIEFSQRRGNIAMSQTKYINDVLETFNMKDCKPAATPLVPGLKLEKKESVDESFSYQNLIGSLMYLSIATRPDITHAVSYLSQYNSCYGKEHWVAAKRVLRYLQGTKNLCLTFRKTEKPLIGAADADWACSEDRRSYTGYCFTFGGASVSWESRKQRTVALSTCEAEYMSMTEATKEAIHLTQLLNDIGRPHKTIEIFNDNQSAIAMTKNAVISSKSKHISIKEHFIREKVNSEEIKISYKPTEGTVADIFTKGLSEVKIRRFRSSLGLSSANVE